MLAHPVYIHTEGLTGLEALIRSLADAGLSGLEAYYPQQGVEITSFLKKPPGSVAFSLLEAAISMGSSIPPRLDGGSFGVETERVSEFYNLCRERIANGKTK